MKFLVKKYKITLISIMIFLIWTIYSVNKLNNYHGMNEYDSLTLVIAILYSNMYMMIYLGLFFIYIPGMWNFHNKLSSGFINYAITRISYKKYMLKEYFKALSHSLIAPLMLVIVFLGCIIYSDVGIFSDSFTDYESIGIIVSSNKELIKLILGWFISLLLSGILYVNISILYTRKFSNILLCICFTYITYIGLSIGIECIGHILYSIGYKLMMNLTAVWALIIFDQTATIISTTVLVMLSTIAVWIVYKDKEGVIIDLNKEKK